MIGLALALSVLPMPQTPQDFSDKVFKIPVYPGAVRVARSSQRLRIDPPVGWAQSFQRTSKGWGRAYTSRDDSKQIEAFLIKEGKKLGKVVPHSFGKNPPMFMLEVILKNGDALLGRVDDLGKGKGHGTKFTISSSRANSPAG